MQCSHCRYNTNILSFLPNFEQLILKFNNTSEQFHLYNKFLKTLTGLVCFLNSMQNNNFFLK